ncbi:MAG: transcriptional repressor LexA [Candidatus Omnitrophica bacterium]|nr:transcriptional repressor LexA [Candidatus Omnitrophota bacterium]
MRQSPELTHKQKKVLEFIRQRVHDHIPPTIREIARHMGFSSTGTVRDYLKALENKGFLKRANNLSRSIELLKEKLNRIPIIASITAGGPNLAYEDIQGYVDTYDLLPKRLAHENVFALRVKGESMIEAGIMDGDIAIVHRQPVAGNGEIIAALLDNNEATLKRLRHRNNKTFLEAANKDYPPIYKDFTIIGKIIAVLRKYP